jgi:pimeloyl-ACP methyl ester carboxylesterase
MHLVTRLLGFSGRQTWRQVDFVCRMAAKTPPAVGARIALASVRFNESQTLPAISVPVLVLAGANDRLTRFAVNREIQQRIPDARLVAFQPAGHFALFEHHQGFSQAVSDFVDRLEETPARSPAAPTAVAAGR